MMGSLPPSGGDTSGVLGLLSALGDPKKTAQLLTDVNQKRADAQRIHDEARALNKQATEKLEAHQRLVKQVQDERALTDKNIATVNDRSHVLDQKEQSLKAREAALVTAKSDHAALVAKAEAEFEALRKKLAEREASLESLIASKTQQAVARATAAKAEQESALAAARKSLTETDRVRAEVTALREKLASRLMALKAALTAALAD